MVIFQFLAVVEATLVVAVAERIVLQAGAVHPVQVVAVVIAAVVVAHDAYK